MASRTQGLSKLLIILISLNWANGVPVAPVMQAEEPVKVVELVTIPLVLEITAIANFSAPQNGAEDSKGEATSNPQGVSGTVGGGVDSSAIPVGRPFFLAVDKPTNQIIQLPFEAPVNYNQQSGQGLPAKVTFVSAVITKPVPEEQHGVSNKSDSVSVTPTGKSSGGVNNTTAGEKQFPSFGSLFGGGGMPGGGGMAGGGGGPFGMFFQMINQMKPGLIPMGMMPGGGGASSPPPPSSPSPPPPPPSSGGGSGGPSSQSSGGGSSSSSSSSSSSLISMGK